MFGFSLTKILTLVAILAVLYFFIKKFSDTEKKEKEPKKAIDATNMSKDPICGTYVEEEKGYRLKYYGNMYHFCSQECMEKFKAQKKAEAES